MLSHYSYSYNVPFLVVINIFHYNTGLHSIVFRPTKRVKIKQRANTWDMGRDQSSAPVPGQRKICEKITWRGESGWRTFPTSHFQAGALLPRCKSLAWLLLGTMELPSSSLSGEVGSGLAPTATSCRCCCPCSVWKAKARGARKGHTFRGTHNLGASSKHSFTGLHFQDDCIQPFLPNPSLLSYLQNGEIHRHFPTPQCNKRRKLNKLREAQANF